MVVSPPAELPVIDGFLEGGLPIQEVFGLPVHPLVVHAAVVLLPLAAIGLIVVASGIKRSKRYGGLVVLVAGAGAVSAFLAMASGRDMAARYGYGESRHFDLGERLPWFGLALLLAATLLWLLDKKPPKRGAPGTIIALAGILLAAATIVATVYVGHLGAELTWG